MSKREKERERERERVRASENHRRVCLRVSQPCACLCFFWARGVCSAAPCHLARDLPLSRTVTQGGGRGGWRHLKSNTAATRAVVVSVLCVPHCVPDTTEPLRRVCLRVSQPCACLCIFMRGECAALSRVISHVTYPSLRETGAAHLILVQVPPSLGCVTDSLPELFTCGLVLYRQPAAVWSQIFRRTLCQKCIREDKEGRPRFSFLVVVRVRPLRASFFFPSTLRHLVSDGEEDVLSLTSHQPHLRLS